METAMLRVRGHWAHFKKPETNNNPLTHDFITKTALIGMIGAVLGIDREQMRPLFPILSEDLLYGVALERSIWKQSWAFTLRRFDSDRSRLEVVDKSPRPFELLREPAFTVILVVQNQRSLDHFRQFVEMVKKSETCYEPVLGLHNCPAELELLSTPNTVSALGGFQTRGFVPRNRSPRIAQELPTRMGFERLPSYQNNEMWNPPDKYVEVVYADVTRRGQSFLLAGDGEHYRVIMPDGTEEAWCLI